MERNWSSLLTIAELPGRKPLYRGRASLKKRALVECTKASQSPTSAIAGGDLSSSAGGHQRFGRRFALGRAVHVLGAGLAEIDPALEVCAVFNADPLANDVAAQRAFIADLGAVAGCHVALHFGQDHNFPGVDVGLDLAVSADAYAVAGQVDGAFHAAIDVMHFRAAY